MHPDALDADADVMDRRLGIGAYSLPSLITIHPTDRCNHHCPWCWFERTSDQLDIGRLIDTLGSPAMTEVREVIVSGGGEPLLHPEIGALFDYLRSWRPRDTRLYTHGGLLSRYAAAISDTFDYVRLSIDAGDAVTYQHLHGGRPGAFDKLFDDAAALIREGTKVGVSMVVTQDNHTSVSLLIDRCAREGISSILLKPVMAGMHREIISGPVADHWSAIGREVDVVVRTEPTTPAVTSAAPPIAVATASVTVVPDGRVLPCCHLTEDQWTIARVGREGDTDFARAHLRVAEQYSGTPHPCRIHDAWRRHQAARSRFTK